jgi:ATP-dependent DNA ligase
MAKRDRIAAFDVQRPVDYNEKAIQKVLDREGYVIIQPKYDGIRGVIFYNADHGWRIITRENIEILSVKQRLSLIGHLLRPSVVYDCEVWIHNTEFDKASGLLRAFDPVPDEYIVEFAIFDLITADTLINRIARLKQELFERIYVFGNTALRRVIGGQASKFEEMQEAFDFARTQQLEGCVIKDPGQEYTGGKVQGWWKMKPKETADGKIIGFVYGTEGKANEGLVVGFEVALEDGTTCQATGLTQALMKQVTHDQASYLGRYVEITRMESTGKGNSRHPKYKCFRDMPGAEGIKS